VSGERVLFVDRDGTLIEEPPDEKIDRLDKIKLLPGVIPALIDIKRAGLKLVMVTIRWTRYAESADGGFRRSSSLRARPVRLPGSGVRRHIRVSPLQARKLRMPQAQLGMVEEYVRTHPIDAARSFMVATATPTSSSRTSWHHGLRVLVGGSAEATWPSIAARFSAPRAAPGSSGGPRKPT